MSRPLISRSKDLHRLEVEGYALEVLDGHLLVHDVPYVDAQRLVRRGVLVTTLKLAGDRTTSPDTHVAHFIGDAPCDRDGRPLAAVIHSSSTKQLAAGVIVNHMFSAKPRGSGRYGDYHEKITTYVGLISAPAESIDSTATARTFRVVAPPPDDSPFLYIDTSSSRAGITAISDRLKGHQIALVGLGGSGAYILDLVAKTPVAEIHLFDGDRFCQHNAFRAPGAAAVDDLTEAPFKVDYYHAVYSKMRRGLIAHPYEVDEQRTAELEPMDFVFIAIDGGAPKKPIVEALELASVPFIDVGMGLYEAHGTLGGVLRVTTSTPSRREHFRTRVSLTDAHVVDDYDQNIQVGDLNALNAALAVVKWKKHLGFYADHDREHHTTYTIDGNHLLNEEQSP